MISAEDRTLLELAAEHRHRFYGKYRAIVKTVMDGKDLGKLIVTLPEVYDDQDSPPAWPCVPYAGPNHGLVSLPEEGDGVWVEFERGDPSNPLWTGCWWADGNMPDPADTNVRTWVTSGGLKIVLDDGGSELRLEHPGGASISLSDDGLELSFNETTITLDDDGISIDGTVQVSAD
jgi:Type VI secretion system/phage-baseplate injector OB domain